MQFRERIRDEIRFSSPDDLTAQITRDQRAAETYFKDLARSERC